MQANGPFPERRQDSRGGGCAAAICPELGHKRSSRVSSLPVDCVQEKDLYIQLWWHGFPVLVIRKPRIINKLAG